MVKDVQKIMDGGTTKVAMLGCEDCYYRYGKNWAVERLLKKRPPAYSRRLDTSGIRLFTINQFSPDRLLEFCREQPDENTGEAKIMDYGRARPILSTLMLAAFFALFHSRVQKSGFLIRQIKRWLSTLNIFLPQSNMNRVLLP
jgi:hypothetical protein